ncbi:MAG TPA: ABC transporter ATP-binding protein [Casimicrobiaceae bacterium]|nr:ABC transporter ATP-binding protein [Casimicrobiaceae bacterium]
MAGLTLDRVTKRYGAARALDDVSLDVADGELVAVLGPSGCGKTTLLRQVAGFDRPDAGRILIGERVVSTPERQVPPEQRRIGIVFQSYALWPHMTVAENVAYGLTVAGVREPERTRRVNAALALVELDGFGDRRPALLSGGQRQRVALARCLVTEPSLVLLDEPLANLDVHLRSAMEREFARFHERTGTTMIYVTHDQAEAMALADRIAVMDRGRVRQVATPTLLYREPADATVARFVGDGMIVPVEVLSTAGDGSCEVDLLGYRLAMRTAPGRRASGVGQACLRAHALRIVDPDSPGVRARVECAVYRGGHFRLEAHLEARPQVALHVSASEPCALAPGAAINVAVEDGWVLPEGTEA